MEKRQYFLRKNVFIYLYYSFIRLKILREKSVGAWLLKQFFVKDSRSTKYKYVSFIVSENVENTKSCIHHLVDIMQPNDSIEECVEVIE